MIRSAFFMPTGFEMTFLQKSVKNGIFWLERYPKNCHTFYFFFKQVAKVSERWKIIVKKMLRMIEFSLIRCSVDILLVIERITLLSSTSSDANRCLMGMP